MLKRFVDRLPLGMAFLAVVLAAVSVYFSWQANQEARQMNQDVQAALDQSIPADAEDDPMAFIANKTLRDAARAEARAQAASEAADTILGFIESGSILLGALIGIGALVFGLSIQDVRSQLNETVEEAQGLIKASEERVDLLEQEVRRQLQDAVQADEERLQESQRQFALLTQQIAEKLQDTEQRVNQFEDEIQAAVGGAKQDSVIAVAEAKQAAESSFRVLTLLLLAEQQVRARNNETAIATLEEAVSIDPDNQPANYLLGYLYAGRKRFQESVQHLQRALDINPNFAPALAAMGLAQYKMADQEDNVLQRNQLRAQAELNLTQALSMDPSLVDADNESYFGSLGGLYRRQGRDQEAMQAYEQAVGVTPNRSYPVVNLATLYKRLGHEEEAESMSHRSIEIASAILDDHPGDIWARLDLGQALLVTGQTEKAFKEYRNVLERVKSASPVESAMRTLRYLQQSPNPIEGIDTVLDMMQKKLDTLATKG